MKIVIGTPRDKNINEIIEQNVMIGHTVFFDGKEYYCEVLNHNCFYKALDIQSYIVPNGTYGFKNGIPYLIED